MAKIIDTDIILLNVGDSIIDSEGQLCHILEINRRIKCIRNPYQLKLFSMGLEEHKDWYAQQVEYISKNLFYYPQEDMILVQHYPNTKWYIADVKCEKCSGESKLRFTSTSVDKFVCTNQIEKNNNLYNCGAKRFVEVSRKTTGIATKKNYAWSNFVKEFEL